MDLAETLALLGVDFGNPAGRHRIADRFQIHSYFSEYINFLLINT
jgi:hypothetical protein